MKPKTSPPQSQLMRVVRAGLLGIVASAAMATGCLNRDVGTAAPNTKNVFVQQIQQDRVDKIDLLFAIDNSISMADKQAILKDAVPALVSRLINPDCVDPTTGARSQPDGQGNCAAPSEKEFEPIRDIHIGVISSSLGGHGSNDICKPTSPTDMVDDRGELIGPRRANITTYQNTGFLAWDPDGNKNTPPGENNPQNLITSFQNLVQSAGEQGCGFEAQLESWYRFLVDPNPPDVVRVDGSFTVMEGTNQALLQQRAAFLRPDSLVAIIMLSDENDCSIRDEGQSWLVGFGDPLPRASEACATDPNSNCCRSCAQGEIPGCPTNTQDAVCSTNPSNPEDTIFLRCWDQKRRFGFDFLHSTDRYVNALKSPQVVDRDGNSVSNPLYTASPNSSAAPRVNDSLIFLAGIVGVPWQYIATQDSLDPNAGLTYLRANEIDSARWDSILGNAKAYDPPSDPLMQESVAQRSGALTVPNVTGQAEPDTAGRLANPINGHEKQIPSSDDLQYACIFELATPRDCTTVPSTQGCDCRDQAAIDEHDPLCQEPGGGYGNTQYYAKAYPGLRQLQVLKDFGANSIIASICPKVPIAPGGDTSNANYGYNPAVASIIDRLKDVLKNTCLPRPLAPLPDGTVPCAVVEALSPAQLAATGTSCDCGTPGRIPVDPLVDPAVRQQLAASGLCNNPSLTGSPSCSDMCLCEIVGLKDQELLACQAGDNTVNGYCYVDSGPLVQDCAPTQRRILRYVSSDEVNNPIPKNNSTVFVACQGAAF